MLGIYGILDAMPKGRNEPDPHHTLADWARPRSMYGKGGEAEAMAAITPCDCAVHNA
jgi:hypothetical protein